MVELLEVCTHQLLFLRDVYPARSFARCKKYGVPVMMNEHPWVARHVSDSLASVRRTMEDKEAGADVRRVDVVVLEKDQQVKIAKVWRIHEFQVTFDEFEILKFRILNPISHYNFQDS